MPEHPATNGSPVDFVATPPVADPDVTGDYPTLAAILRQCFPAGEAVDESMYNGFVQRYQQVGEGSPEFAGLGDELRALAQNPPVAAMFLQQTMHVALDTDAARQVIIDTFNEFNGLATHEEDGEDTVQEPATATLSERGDEAIAVLKAVAFDRFRVRGKLGEIPLIGVFGIGLALLLLAVLLLTVSWLRWAGIIVGGVGFAAFAASSITMNGLRQQYLHPDDVTAVDETAPEKPRGRVSGFVRRALR